MKNEFPNISAGEEIVLGNGIIYDACCDCGLVHKRIFKIKMLRFKGERKAKPTITMRTWRAERRTENNRKKHRHLFVEDPNITVGELRKLY
jgi:hypothetical protein